MEGKGGMLTVDSILCPSPALKLRDPFQFFHAKESYARNLVRYLPHKIWLESRDAICEWAKEQPMPVELAIAGAAHGLEAAVAGAIFANICPMMETGGTWYQARRFSVFSATNAVIRCIARRMRSADDFKNRLAAHFGAGVMVSLVSTYEASPSPGFALQEGVLHAIFEPAMDKIGEMLQKQFAQRSPKGLPFARTKRMLAELGFQDYEVNFKDGLVSDKSLHLLTDSVLKDMKIPIGPRLEILEYLRSDPELSKAKK